MQDYWLDAWHTIHTSSSEDCCEKSLLCTLTCRSLLCTLILGSLLCTRVLRMKRLIKGNIEVNFNESFVHSSLYRQGFSNILLQTQNVAHVHGMRPVALYSIACLSATVAEILMRAGEWSRYAGYHSVIQAQACIKD